VKKVYYFVSLIVVLILSTALAEPAGDPEAAKFREDFLAGRLSWEQVLSRAAEEGKVTWYHWGGSEELNTWIDTVVKPDLAKLGITLETSRIPDTRDAVDQVIADAGTAKGIGEGSVDAIWINGENFFTLASQDLLFGSFVKQLPNAKFFYLDPAEPSSAINLADNGYPTNYQEVPWAQFQYTCFVDTARLPLEQLPKDYAELETYLQANPGRFTYVRPPDYIGNAFVQSVLYAFNPSGYEFFQQPLAEITTDELIAALTPGFEYLRRLEPFLLGGGGQEGQRGAPIYPETQAANETFFNNGEVDILCQFGAFSADVGVENGTFADTVQNVIFPASGMITNKSFISVPTSAPNPAAALVLANYLSSPENQVSKLAALGYGPGVDVPLLSQADQTAIAEASPDLRGVTFEALSQAQVPEANSSLVDVIETVWIDYIERQSEESLATLVTKAIEARR
jgi:putative spermidine/putrescine transport system substrate-binding protein